MNQMTRLTDTSIMKTIGSGCWLRSAVGAVGLMVLLGTACGGDDSLAAPLCALPNKKQLRRCLASLAQQADGKADGHERDWCAINGAYDDPDDFCDDPEDWAIPDDDESYCAMPDPDCGPEPDACGDTLASSGMFWSGDASEGCDVEREQTSLQEARHGNPLAHSNIDGVGGPRPSCWPDPQLKAVAALVRRQSDIGNCFDPQDPAIAGVDLNREWILAVGVDGVRPGGQVRIDRVVGIRRQLRIYATVSQPDPQCATGKGLDRVWATAAIPHTKLPPGYRGAVARMLFVEANRVSCDASISSSEDGPVAVSAGGVVTLQPPAWPPAGAVQVRIEGPLPQARGFQREGDAPANGWYVDVEAGDRLRTTAELFVQGAPAGHEWFPDLALYGPLEDGVLASTQVALTGRRQSPDLVEMDSTIKMGGRYLLVLDAHYDGPHPWSYRVETIRAKASGRPYGFMLHEPLFVGGRWRELSEHDGRSVLQRYVDVEVADVTGDGLADVLLLGAGYNTDVTLAQNERWLTVLQQTPTGHLVTERSFPYLADDELMATNDGRDRARMVADNLECYYEGPDVVVGGAHGLRVLLNDGSGGLEMGEKPDDTEVLQLGAANFGLNSCGLDLVTGTQAGLSLWYQDSSSPRYYDPIEFGASGQHPLVVGEVTGDGEPDVIQLISQGPIQQLVVYPSGLDTPIRYDLRHIVDDGFSLSKSYDGIHVLDVDGVESDDPYLPLPDDLAIGIEGATGGYTLILQNDGGTIDVPTDHEDLSERLLSIGTPELIASLVAARDGLISLHERGLYYEIITDPAPFLRGQGGTVRSYAPEIIGLAAGFLNGDGCGDVVAIHHEGVSVFYGDGCK